MGQLDSFKEKDGAEYISDKYIYLFLKLNFNIQYNSLLDIDEINFPKNNPEITFLVKKHPEGLCLGFRCFDEEFIGKIPEYIFNYFVFWVKKESDIKYSTVDEIDDHIKKLTEKTFQESKDIFFGLLGAKERTDK